MRKIRKRKEGCVMLDVAETFVSINGEGPRTGELAFFVRFKGCNLNCTYCDTAWANRPDAPSQQLSADAITKMVKSSGVKNVTLTGGEPMLQKDLRLLTDSLILAGYRVEIETNGSVSIEKLSERSRRPSFTMDYKLPGSGMEDKMCTENFSLLQKDDTVKFVVSSVGDINKARDMIEKYGLLENCHVYLSPAFGKIEPAVIVEEMKRHGMNGVRLQLQMHKYIWDPNKRGV